MPKSERVAYAERLGIVLLRTCALNCHSVRSTGTTYINLVRYSYWFTKGSKKEIPTIAPRAKRGEHKVFHVV